MFIFQEIVSKLSLADLNKKVVIQPTQGATNEQKLAFLHNQVNTNPDAQKIIDNYGKVTDKDWQNMFNTFINKYNLQSDFQKFLSEQTDKAQGDIAKVFQSGNPVTEKVLADATFENVQKFQDKEREKALALGEMLGGKKKKEEEGSKTGYA